MDPILDYEWLLTRRHFLEMATTSVGVAALATLLNEDLAGQTIAGQQVPTGLPGLPHFAPKAKRVIYLFQSGAPSQHELFDYKPGLARLSGTDLPPSVRGNQRLTTMTAEQQSLPIVPSVYKFAQHGQSEAWVSELMPYTAAIADDLCFIKSMHTEAINHDPGITFFQTGAQLAGRPSIGAWLSYGLGSMNQDLPTFVAMVSVGSGNGGQPLYDRLWGSGFLPTEHQGVKFLPTGDPVLFLSNPPGVDENTRRRFLDDLAKRMQTSVPELTDLSDEPDSTFERYGPDSRRAGSFARNCLIARRLAERDVRFIQLFHRGWDQHTRLPSGIRNQARDVDQAQAALVTDLKERGMLDDTLVVWGGEFGRSVYCQGRFTEEVYGRDHHPRCFTIWMAGGGVQPGMTYGETDEFSYNIVRDPVHVHDLHATMLHLLGIDHTKLTYQFQGRDFRLTDVRGSVVDGVLA